MRLPILSCGQFVRDDAKIFINYEDICLKQYVQYEELNRLVPILKKIKHETPF